MISFGFPIREAEFLRGQNSWRNGMLLPESMRFWVKYLAWLSLHARVRYPSLPQNSRKRSFSCAPSDSIPSIHAHQSLIVADFGVTTLIFHPQLLPPGWKLIPSSAFSNFSSAPFLSLIRLFFFDEKSRSVKASIPH